MSWKQIVKADWLFAVFQILNDQGFQIDNYKKTSNQIYFKFKQPILDITPLERALDVVGLKMEIIRRDEIYVYKHSQDSNIIPLSNRITNRRLNE